MDKKPLLILFEENELNIASLYSLFAQKIPAKHNFWFRLSQEEISHADSISNQRDIIDAITENNFSRGVVNHVMGFVLKEIKKTQQEKVTHHEALLTALRIERSMLEKKCFEIFIPINKRVEDMLCKLNSETERHVEILTEEMKKNKFVF
ncbi:MAG: hypothetical protein ACD_7C00581G0003 [uncultured bacterium]|nr:MAG: hypothetical protein ACD_7C00581G0003 [uncultured bacterium]HBR79944.1 hypothetical protein [Candidatus Moranbacteria bacterium]